MGPFRPRSGEASPSLPSSASSANSATRGPTSPVRSASCNASMKRPAISLATGQPSPPDVDLLDLGEPVVDGIGQVGRRPLGLPTGDGPVVQHDDALACAG